MNGRRLLVAFIVIGILPAGAIFAHQFNISRARVIVGADRMAQVELGMKASDVDRVAGTTLAQSAGGEVDAAALAQAATRISAYVLAHTLLESRGGRPCAPGDTSIAPDGDGIRLTTTWDCRAVAGPLLYQSSVLIDRDPTASQTVLIGEGEDAPQQVLSGTHTTIDLDAATPSLMSVLGNYVWLGVEHIATGYDHIAFLLAVILWGRKLWPLVKLVTAFTLSHSVTLTLSALGVVSIPETITEPAIAATIVFVAALNFFSRDISGRWVETFFFGFVHGFGFASALKETGLPAHARLPALAAFNIGVEIGQVTVIAIALPLLLAFDRFLAHWRLPDGAMARRDPGLVFAGSAVIVILGAYWFLARTVLGDAA
jgi:hypothetical protein